MKKLLKLTLVVVLVMSSTSLFAQKFGRINSQEIIENMAESKEAQTQLEAYVQELSAQAETIQVEFNTKYQEYQKSVETWSDAIRQLKEKELGDLQNRLREFQQMAQQEIQKKQMELFQPIQEKAINAINEVAKAGGYAFVYDTMSAAMVYVDEATVVDLGPAVRAKLGITETASAVQ